MVPGVNNHNNPITRSYQISREGVRPSPVLITWITDNHRTCDQSHARVFIQLGIGGSFPKPNHTHQVTVLSHTLFA